MSDITIQINFFGSFRKFGESVDFTVPEGSSVFVIKEALVQILNGQEKLLIEASVLANDNAILQDGEVFDKNVQLSILPPVCGG